MKKRIRKFREYYHNAVDEYFPVSDVLRLEHKGLYNKDFLMLIVLWNHEAMMNPENCDDYVIIKNDEEIEIIPNPHREPENVQKVKERKGERKSKKQQEKLQEPDVDDGENLQGGRVEDGKGRERKVDNNENGNGSTDGNGKASNASGTSKVEVESGANSGYEA